MPASRAAIDKAHPGIYHRFVAASDEATAAAEAAGFTRAQIELLNVRCSQINRCAFCLSLHTGRALKAGVTAQQLAVLPAWRDARDLYDEASCALLEIAELVTTLPDHCADLAYDSAGDIFTEEQMSAAIWTAITINSFNRVSILSHHHVRPRDLI
ncbi:carboxymuconolactone decarboxylase family protein [Tsukamurella sp. 8F]|uniref:carboxymuconolactone decarboxylase family protein n=1 Tax=unclassified Tsukamurella TaxID=2633480 RepID=UPI0023B9DB5D|nr:MULTISPECIES: carboxymuconolactone decarboxylase family protein [unclassified Tsukamurella]MDF0528338.1 carboxymuconolactone decarboxylase family protein [Tsukamurella sp. 8J]MDF0586163.1 carboxymuconolactone decarboxylase family protein [Tsukamurella sp. 8F]